MNGAAFIFRIKLQIPGIKDSGITDAELYTLLGQAADEVNLLTKVYKGYTDFNIVADQMVYEMLTIAPTFLGMDKKVIYFKDSNAKWQPTIPKTKDWVSKTYRDWLNATSVSLPQWSWVEADEVGLFPPPSTSYTAGGRIYHLKKGVVMSSGDHFPFTGTTAEKVALRPLDDAIVSYCRWKLSPSLGAVTDVDLRYREFLAECKKGAMQIKRRPDLTSSDLTGIQI